MTRAAKDQPRRKSIRGPFKLPTSPNFYVDVRGKRKSLRTSNEQEALALVESIRQEMESVPFDKPKKDLKNPTFSEFRAEYLAWAIQVREPATFTTDKQALKTLGKSIRPSTKISELNGKSIDNMIARCMKRGNKASTINCYLRHLKSIFNKADEWYGIENPYRRTKQLKITKRPPLFLDSGDSRRFLANFGEDLQMKLLATAYLASGRRRCELLNLRWSEVDLENKRYYIRKSKTHLAKWYPASTIFCAVLEAAKNTSQGTREYVFKHCHPDTATHKIKDALRAIGKPEMRLHDLRHSFASLFVQSGGSLRILQDLMGHSQISVTERYAHLAESTLAGEIERVKF